MNTELSEALDLLEKEKGISKQSLIEAIELSLQTACKNHFGSSDNIRVSVDPVTCEFSVIADKTVVEEVLDKNTEISLADARMIDPGYTLGSIVPVKVDSKTFGRIATQNAKGVIVQRIREEERKVLYNEYYSMEKEVVTGTIDRNTGRSIIVNLGKVDGYLSENEQIKDEKLETNDRVKIYVVEVRDTPRGPRVMVSRTHPELVKRLFEEEVSEVRDGIVEIKAISREAGSRTKMAVMSNDPNVDPVGACVGLNGSRVNTVVEELRGEKIDIINYDENPAYLIENALSPAKVIAVIADQDNKEAMVIVPDAQLSLAIGKEGQNARLAAKLTSYKIDIKSESQAQEQGIFDEMGIDYQSEESEDMDDSELMETAEDMEDTTGETFADADDENGEM
ncbi:transcription termination/antitermination protein NusA [Oribacterium sp. C9]|uniref:transcription termination factor NusA n=1 Tax=Oribacterium sp. C9 TaxID=1943579 RepID=UPI00098F40B2|nr:transcription termination factor NusA [Oribacterium sp. C9]OON86516.1 transcription termination/antitermination protein NusA [Oribacterium sp. C9]